MSPRHRFSLEDQKLARRWFVAVLAFYLSLAFGAVFIVNELDGGRHPQLKASYEIITGTVEARTPRP